MSAVEFGKDDEYAHHRVKCQLSKRAISVLDISHRNELFGMTGTILVILADALCNHRSSSEVGITESQNWEVDEAVKNYSR
jgi:hypothetical protein